MSPPGGRSETIGETVDNVVGIDPHKRSLSAAVLDHRGGLLGCRHFPVSAKGQQALETWVLSLGPVLRWGIEGASGLGRHTALYLLTRAQDVRDVCPNRTAERARNRRQGKSDTLDAERIARKLLAHPDLPLAFKRSQQAVHRMAVTQLRCEPRAQAIFNEARRHGHTKKEAMRVLKRQLSNVVHRRMLSDLQSRSEIAAAA
jgi:hypothetical protein